MNNLAYLLSLHSVDGLGPIRLKKLIDFYQDPKLIWQADLKEISNLGIPQNVLLNLQEKRKVLDPEKYFAEIQNSDIKILTLFDDNYPKLLQQIYDPPIILYYKGEFTSQDARAIGVVGTRKITGYGKTVTEKFVAELSNFGLTIVSGLARGVDTIAHQTALASSGRTIACLGGGLNKIFPPENIKLAEEIAKGFGAVISEYPPDYPSLAGNFPSRNRIIAGLSLAVLVTEAAEDSGSLITAKFALEEGREVFAIPGPITSSLSKGPASLIKQGARLVTEPAEIIEELGIKPMQNAEFRMQNQNNLTQIEKTILNHLENEARHIDEIARDLKKPSFEISAALLKMEISGLVKSLGGGNYIKSL